jgi:hypothetical protein
MVLAFVSKLNAFNFITILRIVGQSRLSLSSGGGQKCLQSSGKWVWTLQSNKLKLAQQGEDGHGNVHQGAVRWCQLVFGNSVDGIVGSGSCKVEIIFVVREEIFFTESSVYYLTLGLLTG